METKNTEERKARSEASRREASEATSEVSLGDDQRSREAAHRAANRKKAAVYYSNNREEVLRKRAEYREKNIEKVREQNKVRYEKNREEILKRSAELRGPPKPKKPVKYKYQVEFNRRVREEKRFYCEVCDRACSNPTSWRDTLRRRSMLKTREIW